MIADLRRLTKALLFAAEAHRNQRRKGAAQEPYLNHLIEVHYRKYFRETTLSEVKSTSAPT